MNTVTAKLPRLLAAAATIVMASACSLPKQDEAALDPEASVTGITWEWMETVTPDRRIEAPDPSRYTLRLKPNGEAQIRYDCNHGGSFYELSGNKLSFGPLTATRIHCGPRSRGVIYMRQLETVVSYSARDGHLYLELRGRTGTMRFRRPRDG